MKVEILSKKLIKPSVPTPDHHRNFNIGFTDEMSPTSNVPLIMYYNLSKFKEETCNKLKNSKLESSLSQVLTKFYPLAGRYIKEHRLIDCRDQGVEFIEAKVDCPLAQILSPEMIPEELNQLVSRSLGEADELTDPLVSIQVTVFNCGGVAVGVSVSHRIADASTVSTFLAAWANENLGSECINPCFNSSLLFPGRNIPKLDLGISRNNDNVSGTNFLTRVFVFDRIAIEAIRSKVANNLENTNKPITLSRLRSVCGVILKSLLGVDRAKHGRSRPALILHTVDFREKTCPPLAPHSCGNFCLFSMAKCDAQQTSEALELKECVDLFEDDMLKTIAECKKILNSGEEGHMVVINSFKEATETLYNNDGVMNVILFNSWCRLPHYEADFGWGKPAWVSMVSVSVSNSIVLMDTKEGDGIEAWVSLDEEGMSLFRKDEDILRFALEK